LTERSQNIDAAARPENPGPAAPHSRTTSSAWVKGALDLFARFGLDLDTLLESAGIDKEALESPDIRVATEKLSRLWRSAAQKSGDPAIGLAHPHVPKPGNFDIVGYAMLSSPNLRTALHSFARYLRLVSDAAGMKLVESGQGHLRVELEINGGREPMPRQRIEFAMLTTLTFCKWVTGREMKPRAVLLAYPEPEARAPYEQAFGCAITFDALVNAIDIAAEDLDAPMPGHNPKLATVHHEIMSRRLALIEDDNIVVRVEEAIKARLVNGAPRRQEIAEALGMSERTLQRRLRERGASFNQAFDETRRNLACQFLGKPKLSYAEIAYLLGFTEQSVFFRACKRWFKDSPARVRQNILNPPKSDPA